MMVQLQPTTIRVSKWFLSRRVTPVVGYIPIRSEFAAGLPPEDHLQMVGFVSCCFGAQLLHAVPSPCPIDWLSSGHGEGETRADASEQVSPDWQEIPAGGTPKLSQIIEHGCLFGYPIQL